MPASPTRDKIIDAIGNTKDDDLRAVLMIMLAILEEISQKIDSVLEDEESIRNTVLNGEAKDHPSDHQFIRDLRKARPGGYCDYANRMMREEEERKKGARNMMNSLAERGLMLALGVIGTLVGMGAIQFLQSLH